jgi:hypothetical protein
MLNDKLIEQIYKENFGDMMYACKIKNKFSYIGNTPIPRNINLSTIVPSYSGKMVIHCSKMFR